MQNLKHSDRARTLIHTWSHIKNMANNSSLDRSSSVNCAKGIERFYCQMQMYETNQRYTLDHTPCWKTHLIENFNKHICIIWSCLSFDAPHFICASHSMCMPFNHNLLVWLRSFVRFLCDDKLNPHFNKKYHKKRIDGSCEIILDHEYFRICNDSFCFPSTTWEQANDDFVNMHKNDDGFKYAAFWMSRSISKFAILDFFLFLFRIDPINVERRLIILD